MSPQPPQDQPPAIRIVPHIEGPRSLHFEIIEREVPEGTVIKIGRFTDKANVPNRVTFKSKVVSRGHAEIWSDGGKFLIKDTKSSSGTFLNHSRLSAPGQESKPFPLKDGDVVQLGVDYQGGTEEIYRCVKMRIELNRSWQRQVNQFSLNALKNIRQLASADFKNNADCCICLCGIGPCQALFVAPCSHVFHYKCIRPLLINHHPGLLCPICRSYADLDAPVDNQVDWEQLIAEQEEAEKKQNNGAVKSGTNEQGTQEQTTRNNIPSTSRITLNTTDTLNMNKTLPTPPQSSGQLLSQEDFELISRAASMSATSALPIPSRTRKASNSSEDGDDPSSILGRTLPSSPPTIAFLDDGIDNGLNPVRLGEIAEEDEGTGSPSSNSSGQNQSNGTSSLHESSSSSASTSDNDDDSVPIGILRANESKQTENSRVKGKGVDRLRDENERENVS